MTALFQGGKIKEIQVDRLFNFVDKIAGQKNPGDVGFVKCQGTNGVRIEIRCLH
jgi:hypothetical protein